MMYKVLLAAVLISVHSMGTHTAAAPSTSGNAAAKVEKVHCPQQAQASTGLTSSLDGKTTKIAGKDKVVQLLECCDEQLQKDLT